jgi:hypothetical protein
MTLGEILDRTFHIYRAKFLAFAGIAVLPALAMMGLKLAGYFIDALGLLPTLAYTFRVAAREIGQWLGDGNMESCLFCLISPAIVYLTSKELMGEGPTLATAVRWWAVRWRGCVVLATALWAAFYMVPALLSDLPIARQAAATGAGWLLGNQGIRSVRLGASFSSLVGTIVQALLVAALSVSVPVWTIEGLPVREALRRGWRLARGSQVRLLAAWFMASAIRLILLLVFTGVSFFAFRFIMTVTDRWDLFAKSYQAIGTLSMEVALLLATPIYLIATTLFYYDQRIRQEGYDIERLMDAAGMNAPAVLPGIESPVAAETVEKTEA